MTHGSMRSVLPLLVALLVPQSLGCIGIQTNDARTFGTFPPAEIAPGPKIDVSFQVDVGERGVAATSGVRRNTAGRVRNLYARYLEETGRASVVAQGGAQARIHVDDRGSPPASLIAAFFTGLTLYVVPSWATHRYTTTVELLDESGEPIASKTYEHRLKMVQELFLVFGMPFSGVGRRYEQMWDAVMRDAAVWTVETLTARDAGRMPSRTAMDTGHAPG